MSDDLNSGVVAMPSARAATPSGRSRLRVSGIACIAIALAGCDSARSNTAERTADRKLEGGDVALYAIAPDGTRLWAVEGRSGRTVYFSGGGSTTSHSEACGKNCIRTIDDLVPAQGTSGSAQDRNGLGPQGAGPVAESDAPKGDLSHD